MNITDSFLEEIFETFEKEIPEHVLEKAKISLLDYLAVTLAGTTSFSEYIDKYLEVTDPEPGICTAIGLKRNMNLKEAAFLNGLNGHALDFDDGTNTGIIHLGSPIFSVLLPLAQKYKVEPNLFWEAVVIGYEVSFTMAISIQPQHKELGYHATGTCGILGIVIAATHMLKLSKDITKNAFSIACVSSTGMLKVLDDGSELKPYNVAKTALLGVTALQMAQAGFKGHPDPLGGARGFLKMMTGNENTELKHTLFKGTYAIEKTYTKPYAACRYCHPAIEAAIRISEKYQLQLENISSIDVSTYYWAVKKHDHTKIHGSASAKMSIPYGVAVGLLYGKAGLKEYSDEMVSSSNILELTSKVSVIDDPKLTKKFPEVTTAIVNIHMLSGECYTEQVDFPKGEPENPMTEKEFLTRFTDLCLYGGKNEQEISEIWELIHSRNMDMKRLFECIR